MFKLGGGNKPVRVGCRKIKTDAVKGLKGRKVRGIKKIGENEREIMFRNSWNVQQYAVDYQDFTITVFPRFARARVVVTNPCTPSRSSIFTR